MKYVTYKVRLGYAFDKDGQRDESSEDWYAGKLGWEDFSDVQELVEKVRARHPKMLGWKIYTFDKEVADIWDRVVSV